MSRFRVSILIFFLCERVRAAVRFNCATSGVGYASRRSSPSNFFRLFFFCRSISPCASDRRAARLLRRALALSHTVAVMTNDCRCAAGPDHVGVFFFSLIIFFILIRVPAVFLISTSLLLASMSLVEFSTALVEFSTAQLCNLAKSTTDCAGIKPAFAEL